jgi:hypothetical protein
MEYIEWLASNNELLTRDELSKHYFTIETQSVRMCPIFYSEEAMDDYINFQKLSLSIHMSRLRFLRKNRQNQECKPTKTFDAKEEKSNRSIDITLIKNFNNIAENLLLSMRLKERFDEAFEMIKQIYEFMSDLELCTLELEWMVTSWCKIKRDMWKLRQKALSGSHLDLLPNRYTKLTIVDYLNIDGKQAGDYLLEETRVYCSFKSLDNTILMYDEVYYALNRLNGLLCSSFSTTNDLLLQFRFYIELAQYSWLNHKPPLATNSEDENAQLKLKLNSDECVKRAEKCLKQHRSMTEDSSLSDAINRICLNSQKSRKEYIKEKCKSMDHFAEKLETENVLEDTSTETKVIKKNRTLRFNRKQQQLQSESIDVDLNQQLNMKAEANRSLFCCVECLVLEFNLLMYKMLDDYGKRRKIMCEWMANLSKSRLKLRDSAAAAASTTNADNLHLQAATMQCLVCPELCDERSLNTDNQSLIDQLNACLSLLSVLLQDESKLKVEFLYNEKRICIKKQFYEVIDLLAQMYGFFGYPCQRVHVLEHKLRLLELENEKASGNSHWMSIVHDTIYTNTLINLFKAQLNANMCEEYESLNKRIFDGIHQDKQQQSSLSPTNKIQINVDESIRLIEKHRFFSSKPEALVAYYLTLAHYFVLVGRYDQAIRLLKCKLEKSSVLNGKQTLYHYEIKYYYKLVLFALSMSHLSKSNEKQLQTIIKDETPLSILEESQGASFSVARYYLQNSMDPSKVMSSVLSANANSESGEQSTPSKSSDDEVSVFNMGSNPDSYRTLADCMDILLHLCKYFIEISRYRDATGYIREGLDIVQMHCVNRRVAQFLLYQVYADLIATSFNDALSRMNVAKNLLAYESIKESLKSNKQLDLFQVRSVSLILLLDLLRWIKINEKKELELVELRRTETALNAYLSTRVSFSQHCADIIIEINLAMCGWLLQQMNKENTSTILKELNAYIKHLKRQLTTRIITHQGALNYSENWYMAEYNCLLYEIEANANKQQYLNDAYEQIRANPHPNLYRRICFHLYQNEADPKRKCSYLLETQSIALRHKACSIQIKHRRKSAIDTQLYEKLLSSLSFSKVGPFGDSQSSLNQVDLINFVEKILPHSCVVVALVLIDSNQLCLIRLEVGNEPHSYMIKFDQKYIEEFKQIIAENDKTMKESERAKFWTSRSALNAKLSNFLLDLETNVLGYHKSLLLGSYKNINLSQLTEKLCNHLKLTNLKPKQLNTLKLILVGIQQLSNKEVHDALRNEFEESKIDMILNHLNDYQLKLVNQPRKHICLLVDKSLHQIPWESLPSIKKQPISRMPSIHFLLSHIQINKFLINQDNTFYIVDPGGDLAHTKQKFQTFFEKKKNWTGLIGVAPDETLFKKALTEYELFIYTGHGSGSQYYPTDDVQKLRVQACSILMGCSSGSQYVMGDFEPYGTILAYILAGCPCIVGNLWDVTDRDIDRLTEEFLESWLQEHEKNSTEKGEEKHDTLLKDNTICFHLIKARSACKMTYLNGSAPIVYGLPVDFK